ncbi:MAG: hypothetical protein QOE90_1593 [Thermoplasmata archaeon]|nr:hypothetical protein [Thermoplasmata archaeon]
MLGVFRKRSDGDGPHDETVSEAMLEMVPEITNGQEAPVEDALAAAREHLDLASRAWSDLHRRMQDLENENARLHAALDAVRAGLEQAR